jgi:hypothetical protein
MDEGYQASLFAPLSDKDQQHMTGDFKEQFEAEVEAGGFCRGQKSFVVTSHDATHNIQVAFACLTRGKYPAVLLDPVTIVRRLDSKWIPRWAAVDDEMVEGAEVILIPDLFNRDTVAYLTDPQKGDLVWFVKDAINNGVVVVVSAKLDDDLNELGEGFGEFVEQHFEVIHVAQTDTTGKQQHGRHEASGKRSKKRKRHRSTGDTT